MAVTYFTAQSCLHVVNNYLQPPKTDKIWYFVPLSPASTDSAKFCENIEILRKWANSVPRLKIPCATENCGPYLHLKADLTAAGFYDSVVPNTMSHIHNPAPNLQ